MSIVVGFGPETRSGSGLRLAASLARAAEDDLVLCCVVHDSFESPSLRDFSGVDDDWRRELAALSRQALAEARAQLPRDLAVEEVLRVGRSVPQILEQEAHRRGACLLVVGSADGAFGRIGLGSTSDRLVHSSRVPVALAPRGYDPTPGEVSRLVLAVDPSRADRALVPGTVQVLERLGTPLSIVTFAVRGGSRGAFTAFRESGVYAQWRRQVEETQEHIAREVRARCPGIEVRTASVVEGERWSSAMRGVDWRPGDLLVVGSSTHASLARVFLGSTATRILRHSPVPVLVLPRGRSGSTGTTRADGE